MIVVLDACAVIAHVRNKSGDDVIESSYLGGEDNIWMHAIKSLKRIL